MVRRVRMMDPTYERKACEEPDQSAEPVADYRSASRVFVHPIQDLERDGDRVGHHDRRRVGYRSPIH